MGLDGHRVRQKWVGLVTISVYIPSSRSYNYTNTGCIIRGFSTLYNGVAVYNLAATCMHVVLPVDCYDRCCKHLH